MRVIPIKGVRQSSTVNPSIASSQQIALEELADSLIRVGSGIESSPIDRVVLGLLSRTTASNESLTVSNENIIGDAFRAIIAAISKILRLLFGKSNSSGGGGSGGGSIAAASAELKSKSKSKQSADRISKDETFNKYKPSSATVDGGKSAPSPDKSASIALKKEFRYLEFYRTIRKGKLFNIASFVNRNDIKSSVSSIGMIDSELLSSSKTLIDKLKQGSVDAHTSSKVQGLLTGLDSKYKDLFPDAATPDTTASSSNAAAIKHSYYNANFVDIDAVGMTQKLLHAYGEDYDVIIAACDTLASGASEYKEMIDTLEAISEQSNVTTEMQESIKFIRTCVAYLSLNAWFIEEVLQGMNKFANEVDKLNQFLDTLESRS